MREFRPFVGTVACLTGIDQIVKLVIRRFCMGSGFDLIGGFVGFRPLVNTKLSWFGNYIDLFSEFWFTVLLNVAVLFLFVSGYLWYREKRETVSGVVKIIVSCGLAGSFCSLADKVFWGGSLDFIRLQGLFTFDLKDCYLSLAQVLFLLTAVRYEKEISVREYLRFCRKGLLHSFSPLK